MLYTVLSSNINAAGAAQVYDSRVGGVSMVYDRYIQ